MLGDGDLGMSERARQLEELDSGEVDAVEELEGELEQPDIEGDDLEFAADIKRRMPTADELAFKAQLRGAKWDQLNEQAPFTRINPPSVLNGTLGGQQPVLIGGPFIVDDIGTIIQPRAQVALWGGEDAETMPITVTLAPVSLFPGNPSKAATTSPPVRAFAIVKFGTRGFLVMAEVDIGQGCQFTVSGSQISLEVAVEDTTSLVILPVPPPLGDINLWAIPLAGMLSFRPIVRTAPVTRTLFMDTAVGGGALPLAIPPFSKEMWIVQRFGATVTVYDSGGNQIMVVVALAGVPILDPIILPGDAAAVTATGGLGTDIRLVFGLSI